VLKLAAVGIEPDRRVLVQINPLVVALLNGVEQLTKLRAEGKAIADVEARCHFTKDRLIPAMKSLRAAVDALESLLPDDLWPLPTYQEMLFIR
jgi:glutamine synthetase